MQQVSTLKPALPVDSATKRVCYDTSQVLPKTLVPSRHALMLFTLPGFLYFFVILYIYIIYIYTVCHFIQLPSKLHNSHVVCTCRLGTQCPPPGNGIDASMVRAAERTLLSHQKNIVESWSMLGITLINYSNCTTSS